VLTLVVIPAIYGLIKGWRLPMEFARASEEAIESVALQEAAE
jgi:copper/silver efflux system protein